MQATFIAAGPDFNPTTLPDLTEIRSIDIAPTILDLLDVEPADTVDGQSIFTQNQPPLPTTVFGSSEDDVFDSVESNETNFEGDRQILFTGSGNDTVDVALASGGNRIDLGSGEDTLFAGVNNRILAGSGNDSLFVGSSGGNNVITGGAGADQFWLVTDSEDLPVLPNTITDFKATDGDVLGLANTSLNFGSLTLRQQGQDTIIEAYDREIAKLIGIQSSTLVETSFVFA